MTIGFSIIKICYFYINIYRMSDFEIDELSINCFDYIMIKILKLYNI